MVVGPLVAKFVPHGADDPDVLLGISGVASYGYWVAVRTLETHFPKAGYLLGIAKTPTYSPLASPSPGRGEDVRAVVVPEGEEVPFPRPDRKEESALPVDLDRPTQTDNTPKDDDGPQDFAFPEVEPFTGEMR